MSLFDVSGQVADDISLAPADPINHLKGFEHASAASRWTRECQAK